MLLYFQYQLFSISDFVDRIAEVQNSVDDTKTAADRVNDRTRDMVDKVNNEMMPKLEELQNIVGDKFEDIYVSCRTEF